MRTYIIINTIIINFIRSRPSPFLLNNNDDKPAIPHVT